MKPGRICEESGRRSSFLNDDAGQALTEYAVLMAMVCVLCFWLYYPDNGFFKAARDRYELTALLLVLPGP